MAYFEALWECLQGSAAQQRNHNHSAKKWRCTLGMENGRCSSHWPSLMLNSEKWPSLRNFRYLSRLMSSADMCSYLHSAASHAVRPGRAHVNDAQLHHADAACYLPDACTKPCINSAAHVWQKNADGMKSYHHMALQLQLQPGCIWGDTCGGTRLNK